MPKPKGPERAEVDYSYTPSRIICPCGLRRPEGFYQSDSRGNPVEVFDRLCALMTCAECGRVITVDGAVISRKERTDA